MSVPDPITVMVVDDHPLMRAGLRDALETSGRIAVVAEAGDGEEALRVALEVQPDVVVMDVIMPVKDGLDACRELIERQPESRVLMMTASARLDAVIDAVAAGAKGYLQKHAGPEELVAAVVDVAEDRLQVSDKIVKEVFAMIRRDGRAVSFQPAERLTKKERTTLVLFASGKSYAAIAERGGNSPVTVRNRLNRIQDKVGAQSKQELVIWAVRQGLLDDVDAGLMP
ncbi:MAG: response regulator transcription factor [Chloroflexi bacterium]|nr:response regulator transcription factor [Chloroflexota bacterium]